jgi:hypothetical protein
MKLFLAESDGLKKSVTFNQAKPARFLSKFKLYLEGYFAFFFKRAIV